MYGWLLNETSPSPVASVLRPFDRFLFKLPCFGHFVTCDSSVKSLADLLMTMPKGYVTVEEISNR
jgi:hypothetical protein